MTIQTGQADYILSGNAVFTGLADRPSPASIAVVGNKIAAVGTHEEIRRWIGPATKQIDFGDRLIMPGFHDFHVHVMLGCLQEDTVQLLASSSAEQAAKMAADFAETRPGDPWVLGFGWYHSYWGNQQLPHRSILDQFIPDRPVFLLHAAGHLAWVNSKALELLNITRDTVDPPYGEIARDEDGEPTGILFENAIALAKQAFLLPEERRKRILETFLRSTAEMGITSLSDMLPLPAIELGDLESYDAFEKEGRLTTRIHFLIGLTGELERARRMRDAYRSEKVRFSGLKQFLDGIVTAHTALLVEPYADRPAYRGEAPFSREQLQNWVNEADREGFRIRFHAVGDGAVRLALDLFEEAGERNGNRDARHAIEHIEVIHPEDVGRFSQLGVLASIQPEHMGLVNRQHYLTRIGDERYGCTFPIQTLKQAGANLVFGTDYPIVSLNPMLEIYRAVTRTGGDGQPWNEAEQIPLADALRAYTAGGAYGVFREQELGTLEAGKLADIIVLDRNLFAVSEDEIAQAGVVLTMMDGQVVFEKTGETR
ncbi:amidohydrolase [Brevibacillus fluminis]|uniref:Amidohydrolase n=1 Tax=Brevibacillus fluminis TaxID=511487 RepID=A0A3M8D671_9BACL|nr:amidohydrolase [Brevibacillus fluminis]RNB83333.1 amidohydrolase [Brevibacillus fluminis]